MEFQVFDRLTGKEADLEVIARNEFWAQGLISCDMTGFFIGEDGSLILADECGHYVFCDRERFEIRFRKES